MAEITSQIGYKDSIRDELTLIKRQIDISLPANSNPLLQPPMAVKIPKLKCKIFDGTSKYKLEFKKFLMQFSNCIDACGTLSNANKLTYLRSYLSGYALKITSHLSVTDDNYDVALSLLKEEFLNIPYIVDESFNPQTPDGVHKPPLVYCWMGFIDTSPFPALHLSRNAAKVSESLKISDQRMAKPY